MAQETLQIPLPMQPSLDVLFWPYTGDGGYTTKSAYGFIRQRRISAEPSSSTSEQSSANFWKALWSVEALPRCKEVAWRVAKKIIPVRWWFASPMCERFRPGEEPMDFLQQIFEYQDDDLGGKCLTFLYALWELRNAVIYQQKQPEFHVIMARFTSLMSPGERVAFERSPEDQRNITRASWCRSQAEVMAAAAVFPLEAMSPVIAEALAFRWSLSLAKDLGFRRVCLETDFLHLIETWQKAKRGDSYLFSILSDCRDLVLSFTYFCLSFVRRTGNSVADHLAKNSSKFHNSVWIEEVPPELESLIQADVLASMAF
ncbi:uncharacterized protein LOC130719740 [Lotus japonicus]|uniref:uncharacterized protein LOC130719740 n=1 Tax=Lotus japonicus TaxID=34305 RepID=UPI0025825D79|nr:uncharacterized protein LOC130719740 [Lotus japonicus]